MKLSYEPWTIDWQRRLFTRLRRAEEKGSAQRFSFLRKEAAELDEAKEPAKAIYVRCLLLSAYAEEARGDEVDECAGKIASQAGSAEPLCLYGSLAELAEQPGGLRPALSIAEAWLRAMESAVQSAIPLSYFASFAAFRAVLLVKSEGPSRDIESLLATSNELTLSPGIDPDLLLEAVEMASARGDVNMGLFLPLLIQAWRCLKSANTFRGEDNLDKANKIESWVKGLMADLLKDIER